MKVLVAGCSGMIGTAVCSLLRGRGHSVHTLVRRRSADATEIMWFPPQGRLPQAAVDWADAVVSLGGAPLTKLPWIESYRREISASRVVPTRLLATAILASPTPPDIWVSASAVGYYGNRPGETLTEASAKGRGFLSNVVEAWEEAAAPAARVTRVVWARTGVVLGGGGALGPIVTLARFGLGGNIGRGTQHWPWISLADEAAAIVRLVENPAAGGPVNLVAPTPATAGDITREVARQLHRPHIFSAPALALNLTLRAAARDLLLSDQKVVPGILLADASFRFTHPALGDAIATALVSRQP